MANYFFNPAQFPDVDRRTDPADDTFLFNQGPTRGLGGIRFHDYRIAYDSVELPNVRVFKEQVGTLTEFLLQATPTAQQAKDIDFLLSLGELFTMVAYGQLIIECAKIEGIGDDLLEQIFDVMVRDFSRYALQLYQKPSTTDAQEAFCLKMIRNPVQDPERFSQVWQQHVFPMADAYEMNP
jgi:acyl-CoA dehydrogenase